LSKNRFSENESDSIINKSTNNYNFFSLDNYIQEMIPLESNLEEIKKDLATCNDVIIQELFGLFNSLKNENKIDKISFQKTLNKFFIYPTDEEIDLIFSRYDIDGDSYLEFFELSEIFLPFSQEHAKIMKNRITTKPNSKISQESKSYLIKFFKTLINNEAHFELNRRKLCSREFFSAYEEFAKLKTFNQNYADLDTFFYFINDGKILFRTKNEINLIFNKFDRDKDGKITFNEFIKEITPQELA
jgi:Ca2+-binding EF-hand superfamily protein